MKLRAVLQPWFQQNKAKMGISQSEPAGASHHLNPPTLCNNDCGPWCSLRRARTWSAPTLQWRSPFSLCSLSLSQPRAVTRSGQPPSQIPAATRLVTCPSYEIGHPFTPKRSLFGLRLIRVLCPPRLTLAGNNHSHSQGRLGAWRWWTGRRLRGLPAQDGR